MIKILDGELHPPTVFPNLLVQVAASTAKLLKLPLPQL